MLHYVYSEGLCTTKAIYFPMRMVNCGALLNWDFRLSIHKLSRQYNNNVKKP